jgi:two-component system NarL family response regulator
VLQLLGKGYCNKLIARALGIGIGTVKTHIKSLLDKLNATTRTHAVIIAAQRGLVSNGTSDASTYPGFR